MASHIEFLTNYQTEDQKVRVAVTVLPAINLCLQRGGAAPIQSVTIHNDSDTALEDLDLEIRTSPELILPFTRHIDCIPAGKTVELSRPKVTMNAEMLAGLTEKVTGIVSVKVTNQSGELGNAHAETEVLAFDQWHGLGLYPELLASFVTPNHPAVSGILSRATISWASGQGTPPWTATSPRTPTGW